MFAKYSNETKMNYEYMSGACCFPPHIAKRKKCFVFGFDRVGVCVCGSRQSVGVCVHANDSEYGAQRSSMCLANERERETDTL